MGSTFLELTNRVLRHLNEVPLTSANFSDAKGFQAFAKDSVNDAIQKIHQAEPEWPFNATNSTQTLATNTPTYTLPTTAERIDWDSFYLLRDDTLSVSARKLPQLDYDAYLQRYIASALNASNDGSIRIPEFIFKTQDQKFGVGPLYPDRAYQVKYEWWVFPTDLEQHSNTTTIPERFDRIIFNYSVSECYAFRGDSGRAKLYMDKAELGLAEMRTLLIDKTTTMRDGRVNKVG